MTHRDNHWALVLAAGDGRRLQGLTQTAAGTVVPKQFCSLNGGLSFLEETVQRAQSVASRERICAVVASGHVRHWSQLLESMPLSNIIMQPRNRGTAIGILLPLLHIMQRDPGARILLLPSDHHIRSEARMEAALQAAMTPGRGGEAAPVVLLGIEPDRADPELGYIVPQRNGGSNFHGVSRFVEKPSLPEARELIRQGALWNAFIIAADAAALLRLFERRCPDVVAKMRRLIQLSPQDSGASESLAELYDELPDLDFSRGILQGQEQHLRVLAVPECGWSDLGTPERVAAALRELEYFTTVRTPIVKSRAAVNLAARHELLRTQAHVLAAATGNESIRRISSVSRMPGSCT
jgi:mannose-1-phosphate guanylyltransferase